MRMPTLIVAAMLLVPAYGQEKPSKDDKGTAAKTIPELQKERIASLQKAAESSYKLSLNGRLEIRVAAQVRLTLLEAELEMAEKPSDRIALYRNAVNSLKQFEELAKARRDAAKGTELDIHLFQAMRLNLEIQLERVKVKPAR